MARPWLDRLEDMLMSIENIEEIAATRFRDIMRSRLALERAFEILSEASRHLPPDIKTEHGHIRWQDLADLGNIIRHAYDRVSEERLLETAAVDVPPLKSLLLSIKRDHAGS